MILADKIIGLRKKAGWSQEDLAEQLGVSRQSVSKWEGAQSMPDMDKVVQMSRLFGVSTDYLLKDDAAEEAPSMASLDENVRRVSMEEASSYLATRRAAAPVMALATLLCVLSPVALIFLAALSEMPYSGMSEDLSSALGLCIMFVLVAVAVGMFISCGSKSRDYAFLGDSDFETEYGVDGMVKDRLGKFSATYTKLSIAGTVLCILSVIPIFIAAGLEVGDFLMVSSVCIMLLFVGAGVFCFVYGNTIMNSMKRLLEQDDFSREAKRGGRVADAIGVIYWLVVTAFYFAYSFWPVPGQEVKTRFKESWVIWVVAGILYGAVMALVSLLSRKCDGCK